MKKCDDGWTLINHQYCVITSKIKDNYKKMTWQEGLSWCKNNYGAVHLGKFSAGDKYLHLTENSQTKWYDSYHMTLAKTLERNRK